MILDNPSVDPAQQNTRRKVRTKKPKSSLPFDGDVASPHSEAVTTATTRKRRNPSTGMALSSREISQPLIEPVTERTPPNHVRDLWDSFLSYFRRMRAPQKRLRVCESVSLGEKRFLAIVKVDSESFLLGGSTTNVSMLAKLSAPTGFAAVFQKADEAGSLR
jgi:flagellar biosynthesis protein FliO